MPDNATVGIGQHEHDPEQPAELRDVIVMTAVALTVPRGRRELVLRVDLGHVVTIPRGGI